MKDASKERLTLKERFLNLWRSHDSPHEIALGIAIGVFLGIMPFYGLRLVMVLILAVVMKRVNKVAIFLGVNISLPPTIPFITWAGYSTGRMMLGRAYPALGWQDFRHFSYARFFHFFYALFVGSLALGIAVGVAVYFVILYLLKRRKEEDNVVKREEFITCGGNGCHGDLR